MDKFRHDTHLHLDLFNDREKLIKQIEARKSYTIAVTNLPILYEKYIKIYGNSKYVKFALGFHPELAYEYNRQLDIFLRNIKNTKYIGEIGLDYKIRDLNNREYQRKIFSKIINQCNNCGGKVLTVHSRSAADEVNQIIGKFNGSVIMHWFTGTASELQNSIENGYYFSVNEKMVSKSNYIKKIPINRILLETDAPFLNNDKGKYSFDFVESLTKKLAIIYEKKEDEMARQLKENFKKAVSV